MEKGERQSSGPEQTTGGREPQRTPGPGKVTRTSKLSPGREPAVQRKAALPGAAKPSSRASQDPATEMWMDAAHRGVTALAERETGPADPAVASATGVVQMSETDAGGRLRLDEPVLGSSLGAQGPHFDLGMPQLELDPAFQIPPIVAQIQKLLDPTSVMLAMRQIEPPQVGGMPPRWDQMPAGPALQAPVPPPPGPETLGREPERPRPGTAGDVIQAIMGLPAVRGELDRLQEQAGAEAARIWNGTSPAGQVGIVTGMVAVAGGAITGLALSPELRQQLAGRTLPVPGLPFKVRLDLPPSAFRVELTVDVLGLMELVGNGRHRPRERAPRRGERASRRGAPEPSSSSEDSEDSEEP